MYIRLYRENSPGYVFAVFVKYRVTPSYCNIIFACNWHARVTGVMQSDQSISFANNVFQIIIDNKYIFL